MLLVPHAVRRQRFVAVSKAHHRKRNSEPGMSPAGELSWLCRLVDESLRPYTVRSTVLSSNPQFHPFFLIQPSTYSLTKPAFRVAQEPDALSSMCKQKEKELLLASSQVSILSHLQNTVQYPFFLNFFFSVFHF